MKSNCSKSLLVIGWLKDLLGRAESMRFWEEEQERIDLETRCLILFCSVWEVWPVYRQFHWHEN